jgi:hypothetical protein
MANGHSDELDKLIKAFEAFNDSAEPDMPISKGGAGFDLPDHGLSELERIFKVEGETVMHQMKAAMGVGEEVAKVEKPAITVDSPPVKSATIETITEAKRNPMAAIDDIIAGKRKPVRQPNIRLATSSARMPDPDEWAVNVFKQKPQRPRSMYMCEEQTTDSLGKGSSQEQGQSISEEWDSLFGAPGDNQRDDSGEVGFSAAKAVAMGNKVLAAGTTKLLRFISDLGKGFKKPKDYGKAQSAHAATKA